MTRNSEDSEETYSISRQLVQPQIVYGATEHEHFLFLFSPFLTFADAHTDLRSIASGHSKRNAVVSTARTVQLIIRLVRGWISANKVHKVICPTSPLYNTPPRTSTLPYTICQAQDPYVQSAQRGIWNLNTPRNLLYTQKSIFENAPNHQHYPLLLCRGSIW